MTFKRTRIKEIDRRLKEIQKEILNQATGFSERRYLLSEARQLEAEKDKLSKLDRAY